MVVALYGIWPTPLGNRRRGAPFLRCLCSAAMYGSGGHPRPWMPLFSTGTIAKALICFCLIIIGFLRCSNELKLTTGAYVMEHQKSICTYPQVCRVWLTHSLRAAGLFSKWWALAFARGFLLFLNRTRLFSFFLFFPSPASGLDLLDDGLRLFWPPIKAAGLSILNLFGVVNDDCHGDGTESTTRQWAQTFLSSRNSARTHPRPFIHGDVGGVYPFVVLMGVPRILFGLPSFSFFSPPPPRHPRFLLFCSSCLNP